MRREPIRALVLDKDGTLVDFEATWLPTFVASARHLAGRIGRPDLVDPMLTSVGRDPATGLVVPGSVLASGTTDEVASAWIGVAPALARLGDLEALLNELWARSVLEHLTPIVELPPLLGGLRERGLGLALATNDTESAAHDALAALAVDHLFGAVVGYDSGHGAKPGPGMVIACCERLGVAPAAAAMVGDSPHDLLAGRAAGAGLVVAVASGTSPADYLAPLADVVIDSIADLPALLNTAETPAQDGSSR